MDNEEIVLSGNSFGYIFVVSISIAPENIV